MNLKLTSLLVLMSYRSFLEVLIARADKKQLPHLYRIADLGEEEGKILLGSKSSNIGNERLQQVRSGIVSSIVALMVDGMADEPVLKKLNSFYANAEIETYVGNNKEITRPVSSYRK